MRFRTSVYRRFCADTIGCWTWQNSSPVLCTLSEIVMMNRFFARRPYWIMLLLLGFVLLVSAPLAAQDAEETTITIAANMVVSTLDPIKSIAGSDIVAFGQLYSRLMRQTPEGELE